MWKLQAQFAGYALAQQALPGITLLPRDPASPPLEELARGRAEFGVVSPAQLFSRLGLARDLVFLALFMNRSPVVLVGLKERVPRELGSAQHYRVGVWAAEDTEVRAMILAAGVDLRRITFLPLGEDLSPFLEGKLDLIEATTYNELPRLVDDLGSDRLVVHRPERWGVDLPKDGLVVRADVLKDRPQMVESVVAAAVQGWTKAIANPEAALAAVIKAQPELNVGEQRSQLERILELIDRERPLGCPDPMAIERAAEVHRGLGHTVIASDLRVDRGPWERTSAR